MSGQAEALDLSKRSTPPVRSSLSQSHPVSVGILQSHHPLPSHKLLEKALTSGLSSSDFQLGPLSTSHTVSRQSDRNSADFSGKLKPFASCGRPRRVCKKLMTYTQKYLKICCWIIFLQIRTNAYSTLHLQNRAMQNTTQNLVPRALV